MCLVDHKTVFEAYCMDIRNEMRFIVRRDFQNGSHVLFRFIGGRDACSRIETGANPVVLYLNRAVFARSSRARGFYDAGGNDDVPPADGDVCVGQRRRG